MTVPTELIVLLIASGVVCVLALVYAAVTLFLQGRRLARTTAEIREQLQPHIDAINADVAVARHGLERVQDAVEELKAAREHGPVPARQSLPVRRSP